MPSTTKQHWHDSRWPFRVQDDRMLGFRLIFLHLVLVAPLATAQTPGIEEQRMELMRTRAMSIRFSASVDGFPKTLQPEPLFRYDDATRGYVDGTVWRLGKKGRPLAIITTELHPKYLGSSRVVVYDFLSLSPNGFVARGGDVSWRPQNSAVTMQTLKDGPAPADTQAKRLFQMKRIAQRFSATQVVSREDPDEKQRTLRLLPRPIERYRASGNDNSDGAVFLFVAGRMPGVIMLLESTGTKWQYGLGRLSAPSTLVVWIDDTEVWRVPPSVGSSRSSYNATNSPAKIPGFE